jgi:hexosaminidase
LNPSTHEFGKTMSKVAAWRTSRPRAAFLGLAAALALTGAAAAAPLFPIVPAPANAQAGQGTFTLQNGASVEASAADADTAAYLVDLFGRTRGLTLRAGPAQAGGIVLRRVDDATLEDEGYRLEVTRSGAVITARTSAGLFYGATSLWQLATADGRTSGAAQIAAAEITDGPRFRWRGLMIDSARHYQSPQALRRIIDVMALHKLNVLHWHLTDDQGWRLQIKAYPRLTEVGAWRVPAGASDLDPATGKPRPYGGFYTQDEARAIVAYAAARHVTVVPEIELPGHASAAVAAYPELGAGVPPAAPSSDWGVLNTVYSPDERTFTFLTGVLDEVMAIFPSPFIHIGGDEVVKDEWIASPKVQARMRELGLYDEAALHGYFTSRIGQYLHDHGRRMIGWDEVLEGDLPADAAVMSWRGINGAVIAVRKGHDAVMSAAPWMYFDTRPGDGLDEPPGRGRVISLRDVYDFDPMPAELRPEERSHLIGLQANVWTEHIRTEDRVEHMLFPRVAAVAETSWSPASTHDWAGFVRRLQPWSARYARLGVNAASSAFEVRTSTKVDPWTHKAVVTLDNQAGAGEIRFTTNGAAPGASSELYTAPIVTNLPAQIRATAFLDGRSLGPPSDARLDVAGVRKRWSQELKTCSNKIVLSLEDDAPARGPRAKFLVDVLNPCWVYQGADLTDVTSLDVAVGQVPFNFQVGAERDRILLAKPATREGELEVRLDTCDGERVAVLPLAPAVANSGVTQLHAALPPRPGRHDLCFTFTRSSVDPIWAIDWVQPATTPAAAPVAGGVR